jgi:uncharacterized membrane protein (DUF485 family)
VAALDPGSRSDEARRRRRSVRLAVLLGIVSLIFYVGFYLVGAWVR